MTTEVQKYDSSILKSIGFAFLAPVGSILFQGIVFKKHIIDSSLTISIIVCVIGLVFIGRCVLKEKTK